MELLQGLLNRVSIQRLEPPPPTKAQLEVMLQAALRAPDHANLKPWRSVMVAGEGLTELGAILHQAQLERAPESDAQTLERCIKMPHRAPSILVLIASPKEHPKVPEAEQIQATAAAGHAILLAAHAQHLGAAERQHGNAVGPRDNSNNCWRALSWPLPKSAAAKSDLHALKIQVQPNR